MIFVIYNLLKTAESLVEMVLVNHDRVSRTNWDFVEFYVMPLDADVVVLLKNRDSKNFKNKFIPFWSHQGSKKRQQEEGLQ